MPFLRLPGTRELHEPALPLREPARLLPVSGIPLVAEQDPAAGNRRIDPGEIRGGRLCRRHFFLRRRLHDRNRFQQRPVNQRFPVFADRDMAADQAVAVETDLALAALRQS